MALYKVEICGVNTSKLPLLKNSEKEYKRKFKTGIKHYPKIFGEQRKCG